MKKLAITLSVIGLLIYNLSFSQVNCDHAIMAMSKDTSGKILFGTRTGLIIYDGSKWFKITMPDVLSGSTINAISVDKQNNIWLGSYSDNCTGIAKYNGKKFTTYQIKDGLADIYVYSILADSKGMVWFGTRNGILKFDGQNWTNYTEINGLINNKVMSKPNISCFISCNKTNTLIKHPIDCSDCGVSRFDGNTWTTFKAKDGLASNDASSIAFDDVENKYFATLNGLSIYDNTNWTTYTKSNGIIDNGINIVLTDNKNVWIGTSLGISKYDNSKWSNFTCDNISFSVVSSINVSTSDDINIWPNPFTDVINIDFTNDQINSKIKVTDVQGREIYTCSPTNNTLMIDLSGFEKGIYIISIETSNQILAKRILKI